MRRTSVSGEFEPGIPRHKQCAACHEKRDKLPEPPEDEKECWKCHISPVAQEGVQRREQVAEFCNTCHGPKRDEAFASAPIVNRAQMQPEGHGQFDCLKCHEKAAGYGHTNQEHTKCTTCHAPRHDEKTAGGDAHLEVSCEACHLDGVKAVKTDDGLVVHKKIKTAGESMVHNMLFKEGSGDEDSCYRCHNADNTVGAAANVLPAKGVLCMPCHAATFSAGDTTTLITLLVFLASLLMTMLVWASGSGGGIGAMLGGAFGVIFSAKLPKIIGALILEGLLQKSLFMRDPKRLGHPRPYILALHVPLRAGLLALIMSLWATDCPYTWVLIDKNHPFTAFVFDASGALVILGVILAVLRRRGRDAAGSISDLPARTA